MENAKIGIFEDDNDTRGLLSLILSRQATTVIEAGSVEEAAQAINELEGDLDAAFVDGNLSHNKNDCTEGAQIVELLKAKFGETVSIVCISNLPEEVVKKVMDDDVKIIHKERVDLMKEHLEKL